MDLSYLNLNNKKGEKNIKVNDKAKLIDEI